MSQNSFRLRFSAVGGAMLLGGLLSLSMLASQPALADDDEDVLLTFSTVGDSREDPTTVGLTAQNKIWLQNTKAWSRLIDEIGAQKPKMLFFNGDMIMGYGNADPALVTAGNVGTSDFYKYGRQYAFWRGMVAALLEKGTYVVPVPGNHETQSKPAGKKSQVANEEAWRANMGDLIIDSDRFPAIVGQAAENFSGNLAGTDALAYPGSGDGLTTSQQQLSYSFDVKDSHFVVINTDPVGKDAHAPTAWLAADLSAAQLRGQKHVFVFGHKPAYPYVYMTGATPSGLKAGTAAGEAGDFWNLIELYKATYFCGHEHIFDVSQPGALNGNPAAWQVIVGSGGSPFDAAPTDVTLNPATDRTYAWATVKVRASGKVDIDAYGFSDTFGPTKKIKHISLNSEGEDRH
jgi:hypothetical protein